MPHSLFRLKRFAFVAPLIAAGMAWWSCLPCKGAPLVGRVFVCAAPQTDQEPPLFSVNGEGVSKKDFDAFLETRYGPDAKAEMAMDTLITQESKKLGVTPTDAEVEAMYREQLETDWHIAREVQSQPWTLSEIKRGIRLSLEKTRLLTHGIKVTNAQRAEEYKRHPDAYDTPNKARIQFALIMDASRTNDIVQLLQKPVEPSLILEDLKTDIFFLGPNNTLTVLQPYGDAKTNAGVFSLKTNEVKALPPGEFAQYGAKAVVVRMLGKTAGRKANLNDPKVREKLTVAVASRRARPWETYLAKLWARTKFESLNPDDKRDIEAILFPIPIPAE